MPKTSTKTKPPKTRTPKTRPPKTQKPQFAKKRGRPSKKSLELRARELQLIRQAQRGCQESMQTLIVGLKGFMHKVAYQLGREAFGHNYDDVYQVATMGAMRAIRGFDLKSGCRLSTYAPRLIYGTVVDYLRAHSGVIRLPRINSIDEHTLRAAEAAKHVGRFQTIEDDNGEIQTCDPEFIEREFQLIDLRDEIEVLLRKVNWKVRYALRQWSEGKSLSEVGVDLDVSESRVSQMVAEGLEIIRHDLGITVTSKRLPYTSHVGRERVAA